LCAENDILRGLDLRICGQGRGQVGAGHNIDPRTKIHKSEQVLLQPLKVVVVENCWLQDYFCSLLTGIPKSFVHHSLVSSGVMDVRGVDTLDNGGYGGCHAKGTSLSCRTYLGIGVS
jgi:hypothetical protein